MYMLQPYSLAIYKVQCSTLTSLTSAHNVKFKLPTRKSNHPAGTSHTMALPKAISSWFLLPHRLYDKRNSSIPIGSTAWSDTPQFVYRQDLSLP